MKTVTLRDMETGIITVRLSGDLTRTTLTTIRSAIGKAAAECPAAVLVDLSEVRQTTPGHLTPLATASYKAREMWGVPVLLYGADPEIARDLAAYRSFVVLAGSREQALEAGRSTVPRWMRRCLTPLPSQARAARVFIDEACRSWGLMARCDDARLVVTELAANAIRHARTEFDVFVSCPGRYLRVAVRDGSPAMPRAVVPTIESGRGLHLIEAVSTHTGVTRIPGGKIVWALLRV
ncbi:hypothetical protein Ade02nite_09220 [Paractinoplanes deccanensis]|uniref:STAS domain-containing protein n=1 Tax=Paractinoplanes deccanensis TaxID=113561 RepID=A0ABQ3XX11_9ACTN|nr:ATP-binding protein [Actinoplanes deccanensis]GID72281.1 hypothetical protein Ade02nite_09220 [Actinoplanes deccanensis]